MDIGIPTESAQNNPIDVQRIKSLEDRLDEAEKKLSAIRNVIFDSRPRIKNFEGTFKILNAVPTDTTFENGSFVLSDVSGTRKIHVFISGTWYAVTVT
jgi:hypothetical protein